MKVSIVIPIYRAEKYIKRCIDSVLAQTYKDLEIILVEDGSPDNCGAICDAYAKKDSRIKVIHKENEGVSKARNTGLSQVTGTYVQFVDSDDSLKPNMTETLVKNMEQKHADLVVCGFYEENLNYSKVSKPGDEPGIYEQTQFLKNITKNPYSFHYGVLWNKLFRADLLREQICFSSDMDFGEDFIFNLHYLRYAKKIAVIEEPLYSYVRYNTDSLMYIQAVGKADAKKYQSYLHKRLQIFQKYRDFYMDMDLYEMNKNQINAYLLKVYVSEKMEIRLALPFSKAEKRELYNQLEQNPDVLRMKQDMDFMYYQKKKMKYMLAKGKVLLRNRLVKN